MNDLRIAHWNILNDRHGSEGLYPSQQERLLQISDWLGTVVNNGGNVVVFLCEVQSRDIVDQIADSSGLVIAGSPAQNGSEWYTFLSDAETAEASTVHYCPARRSYASAGILTLAIDGKVSVTGGHMPRELTWENYLQRSDLTQRAIAEGERFEQNFICFDHNAPRFWPDRRAFQRAGYVDAFEGRERPKFPALRYYRGKTAPKYVPRMNIDAIHARGPMELVYADFGQSLGSDHPLLITDYKNTSIM